MKTVKKDNRYYMWNHYNKPVCNGHGNCTNGESNATGRCICKDDYEGLYCDKKINKKVE